MPHTYPYPRAALTVDCVVFGLDESELKILLIERALEPFKSKWALPGGFVRVDETLDEAARRELEEEAGLKDVFLEQLYIFGEVGRDPRERVVSVAYYSLVKLAAHDTKAATDAADARWFPISKVRSSPSTTLTFSQPRWPGSKARCVISPSVSSCCRRGSRFPNYNTSTKRC